MEYSTEDNWPRRWSFVSVAVVACWVLSLLSILSLLIPPLLGFGLIKSWRRHAWLPALLLLIANPLGVFFMGGLVDYAGGAPTLRSMGLPSREFFNIDRESRCFRRTGGCVVSGNEWVFEVPHNLGVQISVAMFGPPSRSYDGPYPTKDEALKLVSAAPKLDVAEFNKGRIPNGNASIQLDPAMVERLLDDMGSDLVLGDQLDGEASKSSVQASVFEGRCLIIRFVDFVPFPTTTESNVRDSMVLIDLKVLRPFAYYGNKGDFRIRPSRIQYLPESSH